MLIAHGSPTTALGQTELRSILREAFDALGERKRVLAIPPDATRLNSQAGMLTRMTFEHYKDNLTDILPALGTHYPMTADEIDHMFGDLPQDIFRVHDWRNDVVTLGHVPSEYVREVSEGAVDYSWPAQVNRLLTEGNHDLILSIGQVVPHEVIGMANFTKNIFVGTGGQQGIDRSHFLGAAYGMERIMGRINTPVRKVLNYAAHHFASSLPIVYILTVIGTDTRGELVVRGIFIGDDDRCFEEASKLSLRVNFTMLEKPIKKAVVYLDPSEFKSTWLGNKSIYRTRMALADGGELLVMAPGVREFGEDKGIDRLIRLHGYRGAQKVLKLVEQHPELAGNLSAAAHLIHGSSEGRFRITYCTRHLCREDIESVGFCCDDLDVAVKRYDPSRLKEGLNIMPDGEEVFFIPNPALGLWAWKERFTTPEV